MPIIKGSSNLVPIRKAVIRNGRTDLITYYIRPEKLEDTINEIKAEPVQKYVENFRKFDAVDKSFSLNDISNLRDVLPKKMAEKTWNNLVMRNKFKDLIYKSNPSEYANNKSNQTLFSYVLSVDPIYLKSFRKEIQNTAKSYKLNVKESQYNIPKNFGKKEQITEQVNDKKEPIIGDIPFRAKLNFYIEEQRNTIESGNKFSKYINFLYPSKSKVVSIFYTLVGQNYRDTNYLTHNINLLPQLYEKSEFNKDFIAKIITDIHDAPDTELSKINNSYLLYKFLLLKYLDDSRFNNVFNTYQFDNVIYAINNYMTGKMPLVNIFTDNKLLPEERFVILMMIDGKIYQRDFNDIIDYLFKNINVDTYYNYVWIIDALICRMDTPSNFGVMLFDQLKQKINYDIFDVNAMLGEIILYELYNYQPTFRYYLMQILTAQKMKVIYMPYDTIQDMNGTPFSTFIVNKMLNDLTSLLNKKISDFIRTNQQFTDEYYKLYYPLKHINDTADNQLFVRVEPISVLLKEPISSINDYVELYVKSDSIITVTLNNQPYFLAFNLLQNLGEEDYIITDTNTNKIDQIKLKRDKRKNKKPSKKHKELTDLLFH